MTKTPRRTRPRKPARKRPRGDTIRRRRAKGHGRNGADAYHGAEKIEVPHESLRPGDACPDCTQGTVYEVSRPGVLVRITGQTPVQAKVYRLQKLRCNLCGKVFTAQSPEGVGSQKHDATAGSMIALLKYGSGLPFNRMQGLQGALGIPLPASTQWDIVNAHAKHIKPVHAELIRQASGGDVLYNDDTTIKILELMGKRAKQGAPAEGSVQRGGQEKQRTGLFTSGVVSTREGRRIALFFSGRKHAGENLKDVLVQRAADSRPADPDVRRACREIYPPSWKRSWPTAWPTAGVSSSRWRSIFPNNAATCWKSLAVIYHNDAIARKRNLSPADASGVSPGRQRPDDGGTPRLAHPAVRGSVGRAQLVAGRGDRVHAQALGEAHAVPACARRAAGQQHLRACA